MTRSIKIILAIAIAALLCTVAFFVCHAAGFFDKDNPETWFAEAIDGGIDNQAAQKVQVGMTLEETVNLIGKPQRDTGSGAVILEWDIKSGDVLRVCFNPVVNESPATQLTAGVYDRNWTSYRVDIIGGLSSEVQPKP